MTEPGVWTTQKRDCACLCRLRLAGAQALGGGYWVSLIDKQHVLFGHVLFQATEAWGPKCKLGDSFCLSRGTQGTQHPESIKLVLEETSSNLPRAAGGHLG